MAGKKEKAPKDGGDGKGKSPMLMIVIVLVAGLAGGVFVGKNMMGSKAPPEPKPPKVGSTVDLGEFLINLGEDSYLKVGVAIGLKEGIDGGHMKEEIPALKDAVLMAFAGRTKSELHSLEGKHKIKEQIRERINEVLEHKTHEKESVLEVYFTAFITQ
ncbi:MAG: flagellar basal body-associated FliL family protein [Armatimonadetes bacterium]|nr:flagellar basal body-associated FliL family protein [Armatimonadota bacterium]